MAIFRSITVTVRMQDGEFRAGLELRAITETDEHDLIELIHYAKRHKLYDEKTKILGFEGLGGDNLYWPGLGVEDRAAFQQIPRGTWAMGHYRVLYMSNPWLLVGEPDDLFEPCLCQDGHSCQTCRLQKDLKYFLNHNAEFREKMEGLAEELEQYREIYGELPIRNRAEEQIDESDVEVEGEDLERGYPEEGMEDEREDEEEDPNDLGRVTRRAQSVELENGNLHGEITRLKRENKDLRKRLSIQRNASSSPMTQMTTSTRGNTSVGNGSDDSYSDSDHPKHGRGGKTRPGVSAYSRSQPVAKIVGATGGKMSGRRGHAKTMKDPEKTAKKRPHETYEEAGNDDDSDEEPPFKRHRSAATRPGKAGKDQKGGRQTGGKTCGPDKLAKKNHQERSDDSDDESFIPGPQGGRSRTSRNGGRGSFAPKASQTIAKTGRRTNNSQASFLDTFGLDSLPSSSRNTPGGVGSVNATSNTMIGFMENESDIASAETPQATFSATAASATTTTLLNTPQVATTSTASTVANPTQTGTTLTTSAATIPAQTAINLAAPAPANTAQAAAASRRAQGWSNAELQALIALVGAHRNAPIGPNGQAPVILHDARLFQLMSLQLAAQGIHRSAGACKNEWNRRGRRVSGIDNRKIANPSQMATSLQ